MMSALLKSSFAKNLLNNKSCLLRATVRFNSTSSSSQTITKEEAQSRAKAILDMFPGDSLFKKSAYATVAGGITAFLVSNGIYIVNEETLVLVAFLIMSRFAYVKLSGPLGEFFENYINEMRSKIQAAAKEELVTMEKEISALEEYRDNTAVVDSYFETRRENIILEAELAEANQQSVFFSSIKSKLDERVRAENERLAAEKKARAEALFASLMEELKKPKIQETILKKCIVDLGKIKTPTANVNL